MELASRSPGSMLSKKAVGLRSGLPMRRWRGQIWVRAVEQTIDLKSLIHDNQESGRPATRSTWSVPWVLMSGLEDTLYKSVWCLSHPLQALMLSVSFEGHVDDTATLISKTPDGDSLRLLFQLNEATPTRPSLLPYLIPKGYIALDGTSLTLTEVDDEKFGVMLIQHTQEKITLARKNIGSKVNTEVDMVGKYVEKSVTATLSGGGSGSTEWQRLIENVVESVLAKKGIQARPL